MKKNKYAVNVIMADHGRDPEVSTTMVTDDMSKAQENLTSDWYTLQTLIKTGDGPADHGDIETAEKTLEKFKITTTMGDSYYGYITEIIS